MDKISTLMESNKGKVVTLRLRNSKTIEGRLKDFDIHLNLALDGARDISGPSPSDLGNILLRGDNIIAVSMPDGES